MVIVEEGREFRFRGDLYSQESTFPLVSIWIPAMCRKANIIVLRATDARYNL